MKTIALFFAAAFWMDATMAEPADHLLPESSYFEIADNPRASSSNQRELQVIQTAFEFAFKYPNTRLRVIATGGDDVKESVVGISTEFGGKPSIYVLQAQSFLTNFTLFHHATDASGEKVDKCEIPIAPALADKIVDLSWAVVLQTTYYKPGEKSIINGTTKYRFHVEIPDDDISQSIEGWTWSAKPDTRVGALIGLISRMRQYCTVRNADALTKLEAQANVLAKKLEHP